MSKTKFSALILLPITLMVAGCMLLAPRVSAEEAKPGGELKPLNNPFGASDSARQCGKGASTYTPVIDLGCQGNDYRGGELNPIMDLLFSMLRFITVGVGLISIASIIGAGIQFTASQGDPAGTAKAIKRIGSTVGALFLYLLAWALLNWVVPGGIFNG